jgi:hypothetical protein
LAIASTLTACGGGGGDGSPATGGGDGSPATTTNSTKAEGVYEGTSSSAYALKILVLENDETYALYGTMSGGNLYVSGFAWGLGTSSNGSYKGDFFKDYSSTGAVSTGSLSASYISNSNFNGTMTANGVNVGFTSAPPASSNYAYNTRASLTPIIGPWTGSTLFGQTVTFAITSNGNFNGSFSGSKGPCNVAGNITTRGSNKNVYNVSYFFASGNCSPMNQNVTGVAISTLLSDGKRQLIMMTTSADKSYGDVFFAVR